MFMLVVHAAIFRRHADDKTAYMIWKLCVSLVLTLRGISYNGTDRQCLLTMPCEAPGSQKQEHSRSKLQL